MRCGRPRLQIAQHPQDFLAGRGRFFELLGHRQRPAGSSANPLDVDAGVKLGERELFGNRVRLEYAQIRDDAGRTRSRGSGSRTALAAGQIPGSLQKLETLDEIPRILLENKHDFFC